jgi:anhydro-N-acetylmuramic acid kinase
MLIIGLISGTSVDAIDAALVELRQDADALSLSLRAYVEHPFPPRLHERLRAILPPAAGSVAEVCELNVLLGEAFAAAAQAGAAAGGLSLDQVDLIASHGQTVYHQVAPGSVRSTLQLGAPAVIAELTGRTVAADFRPRDIVAGGQGAPLVPYLDRLLWSHPSRSRAVQNIGGIANVTYLPATDDRPPTTDQGDKSGDHEIVSHSPYLPVSQSEHSLVISRRSPVVAFDTGPGNALLDEAARILSGGVLGYDRDGAWAAQGQADEPLLARWLDDPYFMQAPPKSTGREYFGGAYAERCVEQARVRGLSDADLMATLTALTARSIAQAYARFLPAPADDLILSGGGARNRTLVGMLARELPTATLRASDELGLPADAKEAVAFAALGYATLHGWPSSVPACTGARHAVVLGSITPGANYLDLARRAADGPAEPPKRASMEEGNAAWR